MGPPIIHLIILHALHYEAENHLDGVVHGRILSGAMAPPDLAHPTPGPDLRRDDPRAGPI